MIGDQKYGSKTWDAAYTIHLLLKYRISRRYNPHHINQKVSPVGGDRSTVLDKGVRCRKPQTFRIAVYLKVGKMPFYCTKGSQNQLQSGRNGGYSEIYQRVPHFGRKDYATGSERLKAGEKRGDYRRFCCFGLTLR